MSDIINNKDMWILCVKVLFYLSDFIDWYNFVTSLLELEGDVVNRGRFPGPRHTNKRQVRLVSHFLHH